MEQKKGHMTGYMVALTTDDRLVVVPAAEVNDGKYRTVDNGKEVIWPVVPDKVFPTVREAEDDIELFMRLSTRCSKEEK